MPKPPLHIAYPIRPRHKPSRSLTLLLLLLIGLFSPPPAGTTPLPSTPTPAAADRYLYRDCQLEPGWEDWSYNTPTRDLCSAEERYTGAYSIQVALGAWGGLSLYHADFHTGPWEAVSFVLHGGAAGGQRLQVYLHGAGGSAAPELPPVRIDDARYVEGGAVSAGRWVQVTIPLADLQGAGRTISRVTIQAAAASPIPTFYVDDIHLVAGATAPLTIQVDAGAVRGKIAPQMFGTNAAMWSADLHQDEDVVAKVRASGVTVIRYPGGSTADTYHWREHELGGQDTPDTTNTGEFLQFTRAVGAEPMITVNFGSGTAREAADWVRYANVTHTWGVQYWEVGNEIYGDWAASWTHDAAQYVLGDETHDGFNDFCREMKAVDPSIQVGAVGANDAGAYGRWGPTVLQLAGDCLDFYIVHHYPFGPDRPPGPTEMLANPTVQWPAIGASVRQMIADHAPGREIDVAVTEYNSFWDEPPPAAVQTINMLFLADSLGQIVEQGLAYANHWDIVNGTALNNSRYGYLLEDQGNYRQPSYYVYPLWAQAGDQRLESTVNRLPDLELALYATRERASGDVILLAINKGEAASGTIAVDHFIPGGTVEAYVAQGEGLDDLSVTYNGLEDPPIDLGTVAPLTQAIVSPVFSYTFAAYSVTSLRIQAFQAGQSVYLPLVRADARSP